MSWPDTPAFRMRYPAAASPPNPPPTICAFICLLPGTPGLGGPPDPSPLYQATDRELNKKANRFQAALAPRAPQPGAPVLALKVSDGASYTVCWRNPAAFRTKVLTS